MSDVNDRKTCSSWSMYYLGSINEDGFFSTAVKLGYPILTQKMNNTTAVSMWQASNIRKKSKRVVLKCL